MSSAAPMNCWNRFANGDIPPASSPLSRRPIVEWKLFCTTSWPISAQRKNWRMTNDEFAVVTAANQRLPAELGEWGWPLEGAGATSAGGRWFLNFTPKWQNGSALAVTWTDWLSFYKFRANCIASLTFFNLSVGSVVISNPIFSFDIKAKHSYGIPISNAEHLGVFQWPIRGKYLRYNFQSQFPSQNWEQRFPSLVVFCHLHSNGTSPSHHLCVSLEPAYQKHQVWLIYSFLFSNSLRLNRSPEVS